MLLTAEEYRESLRRYRPRVFVDGEAVESVADEPRLAPGIAAIGVTYDFATRPEYAELWKTLPPDTAIPELQRTFPIRQPLLWITRSHP